MNHTLIKENWNRIMSVYALLISTYHVITLIYNIRVISQAGRPIPQHANKRLCARRDHVSGSSCSPQPLGQHTLGLPIQQSAGELITVQTADWGRGAWWEARDPDVPEESQVGGPEPGSSSHGGTNSRQRQRHREGRQAILTHCVGHGQAERCEHKPPAAG